MALDDDIRVLSGVGLFAGFTQEQLRLMAFGAESMTLGAGRNIYVEGGLADCAFIVASGNIVLFTEQEGARHVLEQMGPGAILGEMALITESRRLTSAAAETDVRLIRLSRSTFHRILEEFPDTAVHLHQRIAANLHSMLARMERVASRLIR
ncbi:Crp/Fnr family transcriptional regulator [Nitratireductor pacificus]|uniref:Cyclic nucleotide-binding protein n=1 Tax=Nitratireductor pacificus pht-3B TaxID=391937 RepID=K2N4J4_9HYPH|nr:cyclic nucleotide-binding domain-containing protein [Nitratireductor pacificus]EKF19113.1 cyclic nucleotide-binding protein [Nitratireductor pacificus pht-3B]